MIFVGLVGSTQPENESSLPGKKKGHFRWFLRLFPLIQDIARPQWTSEYNRLRASHRRVPFRPSRFHRRRPQLERLSKDTQLRQDRRATSQDFSSTHGVMVAR